MQNKEIIFTDIELNVMLNQEFLHIKGEVVKKVASYFIEIKGQIKESLQFHPLSKKLGLQFSGGKVSKGENYKGLPYVVLDYPAIFHDKGIFICRTMFWWGNYFSFSLHCSGYFTEKFRPKFESGLIHMAYRNYYLATGKEEWTHDVHSGEFIKLGSNKLEEAKHVIQESGFVKIASILELEQYASASGKAVNFYRDMFNCLSTDN